jgi:hypothetical protein
MIDEFSFLGPPEKRNNREWFSKAREELKKF